MFVKFADVWNKQDLGSLKRDLFPSSRPIEFEWLHVLPALQVKLYR